MSAAKSKKSPKRHRTAPTETRRKRASVQTPKRSAAATAAAESKARRPKAKPLSAQQLAHFREKLLAERRRVLEEMQGLTSGTLRKSISDEAGENSRYSYHLGDVASLSYGREFSMGLAERQQNYLEQIDEALQRIEDGTYGICKVTGEPIPIERLEEVPVAKYSVKGKELLEQQRRQGLLGGRPRTDTGIGQVSAAFDIDEQQAEHSDDE